MRGYGDQLHPWLCVSVCLCVRTVNRKRIELSSPNFVHIYSMSKGQRSRSHSLESRHGCTVSSTWQPAVAVCCCCCQRGSARRMTASVSTYLPSLNVYSKPTDIGEWLKALPLGWFCSASYPELLIAVTEGENGGCCLLPGDFSRVIGNYFCTSCRNLVRHNRSQYTMSPTWSLDWRAPKI